MPDLEDDGGPDADTPLLQRPRVPSGQVGADVEGRARGRAIVCMSGRTRPILVHAFSPMRSIPELLTVDGPNEIRLHHEPLKTHRRLLRGKMGEYK